MNIAPRAMTSQEAADFFRLKLSTFYKYRKLGIIPGPTLPGGRYDRQLLEASMDRRSEIKAPTATVSDLDQWMARRAHNGKS
jgi:predicted site-specific integrase-resolvase